MRRPLKLSACLTNRFNGSVFNSLRDSSRLQRFEQPLPCRSLERVWAFSCVGPIRVSSFFVCACMQQTFLCGFAPDTLLESQFPLSEVFDDIGTAGLWTTTQAGIRILTRPLASNNGSMATARLPPSAANSSALRSFLILASSPNQETIINSASNPCDTPHFVSSIQDLDGAQELP